MGELGVLQVMIYLVFFALGRCDARGGGQVSPALAVVAVAGHIPLLLCLGELVLQDSIFTTQGLILFLETLCNILEGDIALDLTLLIRLDASLEICELGLLALSKSALGGAVLNASSFAVELLDDIYWLGLGT
jgi:hypothetical protein